MDHESHGQSSSRHGDMEQAMESNSSSMDESQFLLTASDNKSSFTRLSALIVAIMICMVSLGAVGHGIQQNIHMGSKMINLQVDYESTIQTIRYPRSLFPKHIYRWLSELSLMNHYLSPSSVFLHTIYMISYYVITPFVIMTPLSLLFHVHEVM